MEILKCREAASYGRQLGEKAAHFLATKSIDPDWQIRDAAARNLDSWVKTRQGAEMGAYNAFRRGFNEGFGRDVFTIG